MLKLLSLLLCLAPCWCFADAPPVYLPNSLRTNFASTVRVNQIDIASKVRSYYWTNMVTNITLQLTNVFNLGPANRTIDFFFTGATNNGPNFTATFTCPAPGGVIFRWGLFSTTNGTTTFTVTNNAALGVSLTLWDTNLVEGYSSPVR